MKFTFNSENELPAPEITNVDSAINGTNIKVTITGTNLIDSSNGGSYKLILQDDQAGIASNYDVTKDDSSTATNLVLTITPKTDQTIDALYGKTFSIEIIVNGKKATSESKNFPADPTPDNNESIINKMIKINF